MPHPYDKGLKQKNKKARASEVGPPTKINSAKTFFTFPESFFFVEVFACL